jgi:sulfite oxidase
MAAATVASSSSFYDRWNDPHHQDGTHPSYTYLAAAAAALFGITTAAAVTTTTVSTTTSFSNSSILTPPSICHCEKASPSSPPNSKNVGVTPSAVAKEDFEAYQQTHDIDSMPEYTLEEMRERNGEDGKPIWMSYGGVIYDVTEFIPNHPGGSEKIMQAAGTAIEPFWYLYRQHFASDLPMKLMEHLAVGRLAENDQQQIDEQMAILEKDDPYAREPHRDSHLRVHSDTPMNAEVPTRYLTESYLTPNHLFYIRHHHPVPFFSEKQLHNYTIQIDLTGCSSCDPSKKIVKITLDELKKMPSSKITATLQCSGNRRGGFNAFQRTSGTPWGM